MTSIENYKESIADRYVQNFKKELNFFEKMMLLPISKKMKEVLKSNKKIEVNNIKDLEELGFRRNVLGIKFGDKQLFDKLVTKVFDFLKEKQEKIIQAETQGKLGELQDLVINGKLDELEEKIDDQDSKTENESNQGTQQGQESGKNDFEQESESEKKEDENGKKEINPMVGGAVAGVTSAGVQIGTMKALEKARGLTGAKKIEGFKVEQTKTLLSNINSKLKEEIRSNKNLGKIKSKTYQKTIDNFEETMKALDKEGASAFTDFQKLGNKIPSDVLKTLKVDSKILNQISKIPDDELLTIIGKDEKIIVNFFDERGIKITQDFAKQLKVAEDVTELKGVVNVFKNSTKLCKIVKGVKGMGALTFLLAGVDVWCYLETKKEAELEAKINSLRGDIMKDEATTQLIIGIGSVLVELATIVGICVAGGSVCGPIGTVVGVAIGIIAATVSIGVDTLYYDKKNFYAQNRHDFINQSRTGIKQSIVQLLESDRLEMNEKIKKKIKDESGKNPNIETMEDAWEALIYQEEIVDGGYPLLQNYYRNGESEEKYISTLSVDEITQYKEEKKQMDEKIKLRMNYIKYYIKKDSEGYKKMKQQLMDKKGVGFVEQVLSDSKVYEYIHSENENPYIINYKYLSVSEYKNAYKDKLSKEYPNEFKQFENLKSENPVLLWEICSGVEVSQFSFQETIEQGGIFDDCKEIVEHNLSFILKYFEYYKLGLPLEKQIQIQGSDKSVDFNYIEQVLMDLSKVNQRPLWNKEDTCKYLTHQSFKEKQSIKYEVSEDINQNILYRLAKEFHGYMGKNDLLELIQFYNEGEGNNTGIYYDSKWKINRDWERDMPIDFNEIENILDDKEWSWSAFLFFPSYRKSIDRMDLDSPIEAADELLIEEYKNKFKKIIEEEKGYKKNKKRIEQEILFYIKNQCDGKDGYTELPYDLIIKSKKAGIGNVELYSFSMKNGKIFALCSGDNGNNTLNFGLTKTEIQYECTNKMRDNLTENEKELIDSVDFVYKKLQQIRNVEGDLTNFAGDHHTDELDIPVELERIISSKGQEREKVKQSVLYMQSNSSVDYLCEKSQEYYDYFDGLYRGILDKISKYTSSNDLNESTDLMQAYSLGQENVVELKGNTYSVSKSVNEIIGKHLPELFVLCKNESGVSVDELLKCPETQVEGQMLAKQIYTICLEESILSYTGGKISDFHKNIDHDYEFDYDKLKGKIKKELNNYKFQKKLEVVRSMNVSDEIKTKDEITTRNISKAETKTHSEINLMTKEIIKTLNKVDWAGKRGEPIFVPDEIQKQKGKVIGKLKSWGSTENITVNVDEKNEKIKSIYVKKCNMTFSNIQEGFRVANLINWIKHNIKENPYGSHKWVNALGIKTHAGTYKKYKRDNGELQREVDNNPIDITILEASTVKKYYPNIENSENFLSVINNLFN